MRWPTEPGALTALQERIAAEDPPPWRPPAGYTAAGCFVCFGRGGSGPGTAGDRGWASAASGTAPPVVVEGAAGAPYLPGLLAAREGALLEAAVRALPRPPDVLLVDATGRDHPRGAGLALHLGWALGIPTVGVTHRTLLARGAAPGPATGDRTPVEIDGVQVGWWLRTRSGARPLAVSPGWRTDLDAAAQIVLGAGGGVRTPEPIRRARRAARTARTEA
jgi:deoxyribonuclease V